jgi:tRNA A-37 threonylcarbamoyl transferase component Bud32
MSAVTERLSTALSDRYRIERELGQGGMATVYLAEDLKHDRKVAIKVLKPELAAVLGADRFVQEIKTTAALSHPHILPLFDSGEAGGFLYYVMPFIEGETIREKLTRETQFGIEQAVRITTEVADALDYAHRHGVIHRDIKPENILLHDGRAMVMDFGIALAVSAAAGGRMTETGLSLGTPHYMSPEQATADKQITGRSDIYSLASVLYEMLAGEPPHMGNSAQAIIMKIIAEPVDDVTTHRKAVPPNVAAALGKALEKLPADRFDSAKLFAAALADPGFQHASVPASTVGKRSAGRRTGRATAARWLPWGVAAAAVAVAAWSLLRPAGPPAEPPAVRIPLGFPINGLGLAISRDGSTLVAGGPDSLLYVRRFNDTTFRPISGTKGAYSPTISPDGAWVAFITRGTLAKVLLTGGPVIPIADSTGAFAHWYAPDSILYATANGLGVAGASGGVARPIPVSDTKFARPGFPFMLPDHESLLYQGPGGVELLDVRTGKHTVIEPGGTNPRYVSTGEILYGDPTRQTVFAVPFDVRSHAVTGTPVPILDSVQVFGNGGTQLAVSDNGTLVYVGSRGIAAPGGRLSWIDTTGAITSPALVTSDASFPRVSHDGTRISYREVGRGTFVYNLTTGATPQVAGSWGGGAIWSPSDSELYVSSPRSGYRRVPAEPSGAPVALGPSSVGPIAAISPDGEWIVVLGLGAATAPDIFIARADSLPLRPKPYLNAPWREYQPAVSPDGHWMAYVSNESGTDEVYIRSFPVPGDPTRVSSGGGEAPMWAPHGSRLYYVSRGSMYRATLRMGATVSVLSNKPLFTMPPNAEVVRGVGREIDLSPDGKRFITATIVQGTQALGGPPPQSTAFVVVNWFSELKAKMRAVGR